MDNTPDTLRQQLRLAAHPEGGWYREVFRSSSGVAPADARGHRSALTSIYFLLEAGERSRWHAVASDEVWVHLQGDPLALWTWDAPAGVPARTLLGPLAGGYTPQNVVPAGQWQAAEPAGAAADTRSASTAGYALVACIVGPGFDFADFAFMRPDGQEAAVMHAASLERFI